MDDALRQTLLDLARRDHETRERLAATGELFDGYNAEMEEVHRENAARLAAILDERGWPGRSVVGEEGGRAAWLVVAHAISMPGIQRRGRDLLREAVEAGEADPTWLAKLTDRIRVFEGKGQIYGTHFDWDEDGQMSPNPIASPDRVDERRAEVGLPPLRDDVARMRAQVAASKEEAPADWEARQREIDAWCVEVGWRSGTSR